MDLKTRLFSAIYRVEEIHRAPEISGDILSFWPKSLQDEYEAWAKPIYTGDYKLCLIRDNTAYFTPLPLDEQWGDDWDDVPYQYNAGEPYTSRRCAGMDDEPVEMEHWRIIKLRYDSDMCAPSDRGHDTSVKDINDKRTPWLITYDTKTAVWAGDSIEQFYNAVSKHGQVYAPVDDYDDIKELCGL